MKNIAIVFALVLSTAGSAMAQKAAPEVKLDGLKGTAQQVTSIMYEAKNNGGAMLERGDILERIETIYLQNGQRKSMAYLSQEEDVLFRSRYKHDGFGVTTLEHVVDNNDHIVGRTYYIYDPNFFLTEIYTEDAERQIESRTLIKYDNRERVSQRSFTDAAGNIFRREVYTYTSEGNLLKTVVFDRAGNKAQEIRYEFDNYGQPVTKTTYDYSEDEPDILITIYRYKYDNHRNWIQKTEYEMIDNAPVAQTITERDIKYF
ncbi:MAG: hypothetical protein IJ764_07315 [Bacteroidales bacterium]|nr:hypothetical protein [Bacteroidales bacterium]